jgi:tricorn protease
LIIRKLVYAASVAAILLISISASAQTKLLRFPDINGDRVVFTYGGDLWTASTSGGTATRLTAHPGVEVFGKFSPDGKWIAFTGQYDGDEQVYVISSSGGEPKQLTFYPARGPLTPRWGYDNQVYGWTNDGKSIVFKSLRDSWTLPVARLYTVPAIGGPATPLPMPEAGSGAFSPDGSKMVYSPQSRDFRTEKRYGGGQANQLYVFDLKTLDAKKISDNPRPSRDPMWIGNIIYFNSDRDGHFNLYAYDQSGKTSQVTTHKPWDVRWPSSSRDGRIVYELNGELRIFDTKSKKDLAISINVPDDGLARRPSRISVANFIEDASLSPKGERVLFCARGDIFTAPVEKGPTRNLTHSSGAHDKWPRWSPDGSRIAFISDKTGEEEVWVAAQDGSTPAEQLTTGGKAFRYAPEWAPDGKRIALGDKDGKVYVLTLADKKLTEIANSRRGQIRDYAWSPRGNHLAFSMPNENGFNSIFIWSAGDNQLHRVTDDFFNAVGPAWDPQGNYLYYLSDREFAPQISSVEFNYATNRTAGIFVVALRKDLKNPFPPESDEVTVTKEEGDKPNEGDKPKEAEKKDATPKSADLVIDFEGLGSRVSRVPVEANNYNSLAVKTGHLLYSVGSAFYYGRQGEKPPSLRIYAIKDRKETTLVDDMRGWALSDDGSKVVVGGPGGFAMYDATPQGDRTRKAISTAGLAVDRIPVEEWNQIFNEAWRRYRDFFYVPNMHGYDWEALRDQYKPLLKYVAHRSDLNFIIGEMISELTVQHAYIEGGDFQIPPRPRVALPGGRFELDQKAGRYKVAKIFQGQNEEETYRSPLTEIGVNVSVGDYVLAINGEELKADDDPYRLLKNKADSAVQLTVNKEPTMSGARTVTYRPITNESDLIYLDWVAANRHKVSEMTGGRVGYIHIPDMGAPGIREFIKWYYPQINKEGLVVDVRANGGGNVSAMLIERLRRKVLALNYSRTFDEATTYPGGTFLGPMAALLNENSASDGDIFPAMFREAALGPLIGKRSWGGVIGIGNRGTLIDGGAIFVPESAFASAKGQWIIEGYGVDPDIEVENDPKSLIEGKDPQLERAVAEIMKKIKDKPVKLPPRPAAPVKTPDVFPDASHDGAKGGGLSNASKGKAKN